MRCRTLSWRRAPHLQGKKREQGSFPFISPFSFCLFSLCYLIFFFCCHSHNVPVVVALCCRCVTGTSDTSTPDSPVGKLGTKSTSEKPCLGVFLFLLHFGSLRVLVGGSCVVVRIFCTRLRRGTRCLFAL